MVAVLEASVVRRGRVNGGRAVGLSWAARESTAPGRENAVAAVERPESTTEGVYVWRWDVDAGLEGLLSAIGVSDTDVGEADVGKQGPGVAEVKDPDI